MQRSFAETDKNSHVSFQTKPGDSFHSILFKIEMKFQSFAERLFSNILSEKPDAV